ncbi:DhnA family fructose-bisphosphate aldolase class Ia [Microbacterium sp. W4I4]|uniref:Cgl0159 family (beta/alpha)8-fold protein n=1 Tax=Microbacterium sp. W4I4 TaxID=3042295 RepID=UPI0027805E23|nr:deoxyribose-phosphate aldolase [Microbacterium sp. W4I4]MDQ0615010.1 DhnA family fructose-bisphosphate aldolase class Ia [Microbacterium sp. W4I4]
MTRIEPADFARLRDVRAADPGAVETAHRARTRRPLLGDDGRLFIVAADHPARGALGVGGDPLAMADRGDLLERLAEALSNPQVDGVLGTADILDDLALMGLLENKVVVASMNRGGLRGSAFEMDDRYTAIDAQSARRMGADMTKALVRVDVDDPGTVSTLEATGQVVAECAAADIPIMLEPFISRRVDGLVVNDLSAEAIIHSIAIAAGLGGTSSHSWLKIPVIDDMERVMAATTLPTMLLGGDSGPDLDGTLQQWERALRLPGVRGLTVGRTMLYPPDGDVSSAVARAAEMVHPSRTARS